MRKAGQTAMSVDLYRPFQHCFQPASTSVWKGKSPILIYFGLFRYLQRLQELCVFTLGSPVPPALRSPFHQPQDTSLPVPQVESHLSTPSKHALLRTFCLIFLMFFMVFHCFSWIFDDSPATSLDLESRSRPRTMEHLPARPMALAPFSRSPNS